jgi:hypothetical protein
VVDARAMKIRDARGRFGDFESWRTFVRKALLGKRVLGRCDLDTKRVERLPNLGRPAARLEAMAHGRAGEGVRVNGDTVFVASALATYVVGLKQETELHWRARFFDIDLGILEILPLHDAFRTDPVVRSVNLINAKSGLRQLKYVSA